MKQPTNWWTAIWTTSVEILAWSLYERNLIIVANPKNTDTIWLAFWWSRKWDTPVEAQVWSWIPLSPWGSLNLSELFWLLNSSMSAIAETWSQIISWVYL